MKPRTQRSLRRTPLVAHPPSPVFKVRPNQMASHPQFTRPGASEYDFASTARRIARRLTGYGEALPTASLGFLDKQLHSLDCRGPVVAEAGAGARVVQIQDGVDARGLALVDVRCHARGERRRVGRAQGPVVEIARPVLMCQAHRGDDRDSRVQFIAGAPERKRALDALDAVRQPERDRTWPQQPQHGFAAAHICGELTPAVRTEVRVGVVPEDVPFLQRALRDPPCLLRVAAPGRLLDVPAEQEEGCPDAVVPQDVEESGSGGAGAVVESQREHIATRTHLITD